MDRLGGTSSNLLYFSTESGNLRYGPPHLISRRPLMADGDNGCVVVLCSDAVQLVCVASDRVIADCFGLGPLVPPQCELLPHTLQCIVR